MDHTQIRVLTLRKKPQLYDWLWKEGFDRIDSLYDLDHVLVTEPLKQPCQDTVRWMNKVFLYDAYYYCRWDSDIILGKDTFRQCYEMVKNGEADAAGVNGWHTIKRTVPTDNEGHTKQVDQIVFGDTPGNWVEGVDSFWIMAAEQWPKGGVWIDGCPWGDCEKYYMKSALKCYYVDAPYIHFGPQFHQSLRFEHYAPSKRWVFE